jgi:cell division septation protein DedD
MLGLALLPLLAVGASACMGYPADGSVLTPGSPSQTASSRLPSLLSQLQGNGGAGLEVFDGSQNQVLAAQDAQGKGVPVVPPSPTATDAVAGATTTRTTTPGPEAAGVQPTRTATPTPVRSATATATAAVTSTSTPTPAATATPTATPATPTATPTPEGPPTEGGRATPPSE